jgi:ADP-ribosyl-[dinitrogen reductase] hydrolase
MEDYEGLVLHVPMRDEDEFSIDPVRIGHAAALATTVLHRGGRVLIHCTGGLNRSAVVAARTIEIYVGCTPGEAVNLLRKMRDPYVLCNRAFERWVTGSQLPTAETSAFRLGKGGLGS